MVIEQPDKNIDKKLEEKEFTEEVIQVDRITRVVAGGKRMRFRAAVVIGDQKGKVGIGVAKANEVILAVQKAIKKAEKEVISVPIINDTIPHEVRVKVGSAQLLLKPCPKGTGIIAGGVVRSVAEAAGIKNLIGKILGSQNKINNLKALILAFKSLRPIKIPASQFERWKSESRPEPVESRHSDRSIEEGVEKKVSKNEKSVKKGGK